jgi:hypothetical protein
LSLSLLLEETTETCNVDWKRNVEYSAETGSSQCQSRGRVSSRPSILTRGGSAMPTIPPSDSMSFDSWQNMATPNVRLAVDPAESPLSSSPTVVSLNLSSAASRTTGQNCPEHLAAVEARCLQARKSGVCWIQGASHPWKSSAFWRTLRWFLRKCLSPFRKTASVVAERASMVEG